MWYAFVVVCVFGAQTCEWYGRTEPFESWLECQVGAEDMGETIGRLTAVGAAPFVVKTNAFCDQDPDYLVRRTAPEA